MFFLESINLNHSNIKDKLEELKSDVYARIPESKCLGCPIAKGTDVVAECCKKASPPMYYIEFVNLYKHIENTWSKENKKNLIYKAFQTILNKESEKPCILLDGDKCSVYNQRWTNCRTYGMIPEDEWISRAKGWIYEALVPFFTEKRKVKKARESTVLNMKVKEEVEEEYTDTEAINSYIEEIFKDGFDPERINNILKEHWEITNVKVYNQCTNLAVEEESMVIDEVYDSLREIEKKFVGYNIDEDELNITYLQFHMYLLLFIVGEEKVKALLSIRDNWAEDQKELFLKDIYNSIDNMVIDNFKNK